MIDVPIKLEAVVGSVVVKLSDIEKLSLGSLLPLDTLAGEEITIRANGKDIAKGEIVVINEHYGVKILKVGG